MTNTGTELETTGELQVQDASIVAQLATAEINALVTTARAYPRSIKVARQSMIEMATLDEQAATECMYALPRGGKAIEGPSIRFAEMIAQSWGNNRVAARTTHVDRTEKFVEAEGVFLDAQTNTATMARVRRRIVDSKGRLYNDDMILVTSNAAQSIARRNAILSGVPRAVWRAAYDASRHVVMGDVQTLNNRRSEALAAFGRFGLTADQVFKIMGVDGADGIGLEKLVTLRGTYSGLINGELTVEELLRSIEPAKADRVTPGTASLAAPKAFDNSLPSADAPAKHAATPSPNALPQAQTPPPAAAVPPPQAAKQGAGAAEAALSAQDTKSPPVATAAPAINTPAVEQETTPDEFLDLEADLDEASNAGELDRAWKRWSRVYLSHEKDKPKQQAMTRVYARAQGKLAAKIKAAKVRASADAVA